MAVITDKIMVEITPIDISDVRDWVFSEMGIIPIKTEVSFGFYGGWYGNDLILYSFEDGNIYYYKDAKSQESHWIRLLTDEEYENQIFTEVWGKDKESGKQYFTDYEKFVDGTDINGFLAWFN